MERRLATQTRSVQRFGVRFEPLVRFARGGLGLVLSLVRRVACGINDICGVCGVGGWCFPSSEANVTKSRAFNPESTPRLYGYSSSAVGLESSWLGELRKAVFEISDTPGCRADRGQTYIPQNQRTPTLRT
jgi:hypothetical protein